MYSSRTLISRGMLTSRAKVLVELATRHATSSGHIVFSMFMPNFDMNIENLMTRVGSGTAFWLLSAKR